MDNQKGTLGWVILYDIESKAFSLVEEEMLFKCDKPYLPPDDGEGVDWQSVPDHLAILDHARGEQLKKVLKIANELIAGGK